MPSIHPLTQDACVLAAGATLRLTFRRGELEMLLDPEPGRTTTRVPLMRGRDDEAGDLTLSKTGRTLQARVHQPPRLFLASAEEARAFLRGERHVLALSDATDDDTGSPDRAPAAMRPPGAPAPARKPRPAPAPAPPSSAREGPSFEDVLRGVHACPAGLTCRPGRGTLYPLAPLGRPEGLEVLLVGYNPRIALTGHLAMPSFAAWRDEGASGLARAAAEGASWARSLEGLLPEGWRLDDGRAMATWVWKWPTRVPPGGEAADVYAERCATKHFRDELAALRPRAVVAHETGASEWLAREAEARGLEVREPPAGVRRSEALGWVEPSDAWGWRAGLVLLKDADARDRQTERFARLALARILA